MDSNSILGNESHESDEPIDLEALAKAGHQPPKAKRYKIRIDRQYYVVSVPQMTGRQLLELAGKLPPTGFMISQKFCHGEAKKIGLDEIAEFTTKGVERFMSLPLDQTEGGR